MNDEMKTTGAEGGEPGSRAHKRHLPEPLDRTGFAVQERVLWPVQDHLSVHGDLARVDGKRRRALLGGGALAVVVAGVAVAVALSSGSGSSSPSSNTVAATPPPQREPLIETASDQPTESAETKRPAPTLHGAKPVFSPPSSASKGGEKTGAATAAKDGESHEATGSTSEAATSSGDASPAGATISSDPDRSSGSDAGEAEAAGAEAGSGAEAGTGATAANARAEVADGPPAGPAALKVAREFAKGFVAYETGGEASDFKGAFKASATPELTKALLERPPRQPAGVKVPKAKVLNVVAGPSQGRVYKVSVSLLRVGVTSELRLDMEKLKNAEWRVTNVLG